jgi:hypothetical protein
MYIELPAPTNPSEAWTLAKAWEKAITLETQGYRFEEGYTEGLVMVFKPGSRFVDYIVELRTGKCMCRANEINGHRFCKHSLAAAMWHNRNEAAREAAQVAEMERRAEEEAQAEHPLTGVEPLQY